MTTLREAMNRLRRSIEGAAAAVAIEPSVGRGVLLYVEHQGRIWDLDGDPLTADELEKRRLETGKGTTTPIPIFARIMLTKKGPIAPWQKIVDQLTDEERKGLDETLADDDRARLEHIDGVLARGKPFRVVGLR